MYKSSKNKYLISVTCLFTLAMLIPNNYREILYFNIESASQGQYWRYITGHFIHYSWLHCICNLLGLYCLYYIFSHKKSELNWYLPTIFIIFFISFGLASTSDNLKWYIGYSDILIGLLSYSSVKTFDQNALLSFAFLLFMTTYIASQTIFGGELVQSTYLTGINAASYAHLFGLIGGLIYGFI